jgi:hypothetical protein
MEIQLVDDMGGHGRALEALKEVLDRHDRLFGGSRSSLHCRGSV